jgi:dipeptidyl aminopeptidase/acylaminoacyl peptidase
MTAFDQFDAVDLRVAGALEDLAAASRPDYIDDVLKVTAGRRQRPRWTFLERLLPMDTTMQRPIGPRSLPVRPLVILLLLLIVAAAAAVYVGSRSRVPAPFGPAANGQVLYIADGDIYVRDNPAGEGRLLVGLPGDQFEPTWSPTGEWFWFVTDTGNGASFQVARADGSDAHELTMIPKEGNAQAAWRPDGQAVGFVYEVDGFPRLSIGFVDGSPTRLIDLGKAKPTELAWRPPNGKELLLRVVKPGNVVDYVTIRPDGTGRHDFGLPSSKLMSAEWSTSGAVWSPDGSQIAYTRVAPGGGPDSGPFRIHVMNADGTGDIALPGSLDPKVSENWPLFSPDGQWILINRWFWGSKGDPQKAWLAVLPADGSAPARDIGPRFRAEQEIQLAKGWSPDGTRVVAYQGEDGGAFSIDPVTGEVEKLTWTTDYPDTQRVAR